MQRQYIFTKNGFYPESAGEQDEGQLADTAVLLYDMARTENPSKLTVSGYFLYLVSDAFFKELTQLPELELVRDKIKVVPSQECIDRLLQDGIHKRTVDQGNVCADGAGFPTSDQQLSGIGGNVSGREESESSCPGADISSSCGE